MDEFDVLRDHLKIANRRAEQAEARCAEWQRFDRVRSDRLRHAYERIEAYEATIKRLLGEKVGDDPEAA